MKDDSDLPLQVSVQEGVFAITIGIDRIVWAAEHSKDWNPFDDEKNDYVQKWKVVDSVEFAKDVMAAMLDEREDGSSLLTDLFDKALMIALEDGSLGCDECTTGKSKYASDYEEEHQ